MFYVPITSSRFDLIAIRFHSILHSDPDSHRYMAEILHIRRKTLYNLSINQPIVIFFELLINTNYHTLRMPCQDYVLHKNSVTLLNNLDPFGIFLIKKMEFIFSE